MYNLPEIKMSIKYKKYVPFDELISFSNSENVHKVAKSLFDKDNFNMVEEVIVLFLNRANKFVAYNKLSKGGISASVIDPRIVFTAALLTNSSGVILAHNHPSNNLKPSDTDIELTKKLAKAGDFMDIKVIDHLILTKEGYFSMVDNGII